jgi:type IV pilus assembly protein PilY1
VWTYGGSDAKRKFNTDAEATTYDNNLFTDADLVNVGQFDSSGGVLTATQQSAAPAGKGWFIEYGVNNERTGTTGTLVNGCVLWSSFEPSGASGAVCATTGTNVARLYQANFATGVANCAVGFYDPGNSKWARFLQTNTNASPSEPAPQFSIGGGQVSLGVVQQPPGGEIKNSGIRQNDEGVKSLYQLELDRRGHDCRHGGKNCN